MSLAILAAILELRVTNTFGNIFTHFFLSFLSFPFFCRICFPFTFALFYSFHIYRPAELFGLVGQVMSSMCGVRCVLALHTTTTHTGSANTHRGTEMGITMECLDINKDRSKKYIHDKIKKWENRRNKERIETKKSLQHYRNELKKRQAYINNNTNWVEISKFRTGQLDLKPILSSLLKYFFLPFRGGGVSNYLP